MLSRRVFVLVAGLALPGCPALVDDEYRAVDQVPGAAGSSDAPGVGGSSEGAGGSGGSAVIGVGGAAGAPAPVGGAAGTAGSGATGGSVILGLGGSESGGVTGTGGSTGGTGGATGGSTGTGGATGGTVGTGGAAGSSVGTGGAAGGVAGASAGAAGAAGATAGSAGEPGGTAGASGSAGTAGENGSGGAGEPFCQSSPTACLALRSALIHRYSFDGTGTSVVDTYGGADGTAMGGASLSGVGELTLAGGSSGQYVNLPNNLISVLDAATIETWVIWQGGTAWQRVFDFGDAMANFCVANGPSALEGQPGECGRTYLMLTPLTDDPGGGVVLSSFMRQPGTHPDGDLEIRGSAPTMGSVMHLAVVVDDEGNSIDVYVDGEQEGSETFTDQLSDINDINNWLGRSQFTDDASRGFRGTYLEFRIYDAALSESELETSFTEGPDAAFLD